MTPLDSDHNGSLQISNTIAEMKKVVDFAPAPRDKESTIANLAAVRNSPAIDQRPRTSARPFALTVRTPSHLVKIVGGG
jgi:hypothetical protein